VSRFSRRQLLKYGATAPPELSRLPTSFPPVSWPRTANRAPTIESPSARSASAAERRCFSTSCPRPAASSPCATAIFREPRSSKPSEKAIGPFIRTTRRYSNAKTSTPCIRCHGRFSAGASLHSRLQAGGRLCRKAVDALYPRGRVRQRRAKAQAGFSSRTQQRSIPMNRIACELCARGLSKYSNFGRSTKQVPKTLRPSHLPRNRPERLNWTFGLIRPCGRTTAIG